MNDLLIYLGHCQLLRLSVLSALCTIRSEHIELSQRRGVFAWCLAYAWMSQERWCSGTSMGVFIEASV